MSEQENPPAEKKPKNAPDLKADPEVDDGTFVADKHRYFAEDDIEGSVGDGGLSTVKYKKGQEIKDEPLALQLIVQGQPIEKRTEQVKLKKTHLDPKDPKTGRWEYREGANKVDTVEPPEPKPADKK